MLARKKVELDILMVSSFTHPNLVKRMAAVTSAVEQFDPVSQFWVGE